MYLPVQTHIRANPAHQGYLLLSKSLRCVKLMYSMNSQDVGAQLERVLPALSSETRTEGSCLALHVSHLGHIGRGQVHCQLQLRPGSPSGNSPLLPPILLLPPTASRSQRLLWRQRARTMWGPSVPLNERFPTSGPKAAASPAPPSSSPARPQTPGGG